MSVSNGEFEVFLRFFSTPTLTSHVTLGQGAELEVSLMITPMRPNPKTWTLQVQKIVWFHVSSCCNQLLSDFLCGLPTAFMFLKPLCKHIVTISPPQPPATGLTKKRIFQSTHRDQHMIQGPRQMEPQRYRCQGEDKS